jgi:hypothetical protein
VSPHESWKALSHKVSIKAELFLFILHQGPALPVLQAEFPAALMPMHELHGFAQLKPMPLSHDEPDVACLALLEGLLSRLSFQDAGMPFLFLLDSRDRKALWVKDIRHS